VTLGASHELDDKTWVSGELTYDHSKETVGLFDKPITLLLSANRKLHENILFKKKLDIGKEITLTTAWKQKVDNNLTIVGNNRVNVTKLWNNPSKSNYNFSLKMEYTL
jgi:hypothetical protein